MINGRINAADVVHGVRFRNGGREVVIERTEKALDQTFEAGRFEGIHESRLRIEQMKVQAESLRQHIRRLEDSIRQVKSHQASEIIFAIANNPLNDVLDAMPDAPPKEVIGG